jgi:regulator of protease activity HflC (stomatin/prohibitin superfamily)
MAKQAEAEREKRANIIAAEGELKASENLLKAAETLSKNPMAIQLRTLQTIRDIAAYPSEKIVLFLPSDMGDLIKKFSK